MKNIHVVMACLIICLITAGCGGGGGGSSSDRQFNLVVLDSIEGSGVAINNRGQVLINGTDVDYIWSYAQGTSAVQTIPGTADIIVGDINDSGQIVGIDNTRAVVIEPSGTKRLLPPISGDTESTAFRINNVGQVAGCSGNRRYYQFPGGILIGKHIVWESDGSVRQLNTLDKYGDGNSFNINDLGIVVGIAESTEPESYHPPQQPVMWDRNGHMTVLQTPNNSNGNAMAINRNGVIAGSYGGYNDVETMNAIVWAPDGSYKDLRLPSANRNTMAVDINDAGWVVGVYSYTPLPNMEYHAVCWSPDGQAFDLGESIQGESSATGINRDGVIAGWVKGEDGKSHPAVWVPVK